MKYFIPIILILVSCSSNKSIVKSQTKKNEKTIYIETINKQFSTATIVGSSARKLIEDEKNNLRQKKIKDLINNLKNKKGVTVSTTTDRGSVGISIQNEVLFDFDKAELTPKALIILTQLYEEIKDMIDTTQFIITGHTDNIGRDTYNLKLSKVRAEVVGNFLKNKGAKKENITEFGKGYHSPIDTNKTEQGRMRNRRVEIIITL